MNEQQRPTRARYVVITFMVTLAMVTYLDRACIGAMKQHIAADFSLDDAQMGWVFTSFILAYAIFEIPTARWADRHGAGAVLTRIVTWWSVFTLMTAGAFNYASLLVTRFLFGAGEAGAFPCVARVLSRWVPLRERGTAKGIFFAGAYASAALTTFTVNALLPFMSWRAILLVFGCVGFVWVIAWKRWFRDEPTDHPAANEAERALILADRAPVVPHPAGFAFWRGLLKQRNVLLLCLSYMPNCATFYFCITWLPSYLREHRGFESTQLGMLAALPLALAIGTQFLGGFWSDKIVVRFGLRAGRRTPGIVGYGVAALFVVAATLTPDPKTAAVLFALTVRHLHADHRLVVEHLRGHRPRALRHRQRDHEHLGADRRHHHAARRRLFAEVVRQLERAVLPVGRTLRHGRAVLGVHRPEEAGVRRR